MKYTLFDGELVSLPWAQVLKDMQADGVDFGVNEGHRTLARQRWFYRCMLTKACNNGNLAAFPSPTAPHIRTGRIDHAMDFANPEAVMGWLSSHGLGPTRPAGAGTSRWEPWHVEVDAAALKAYYETHKQDEWDVLPKHLEHAVRKLLYHRRQALEQSKTGKGRRYRSHVKWRGWWRKRVQAAERRARKTSVRRLLRKALEV